MKVAKYGQMDWPGLLAHMSTYLYTYLEHIAQSLRNMSEEICQQQQTTMTTKTMNSTKVQNPRRYGGAHSA